MGKIPKITPKQERFCQEYVIDLNGTQAAIRAGYSAKTANQQATKLLAKAHIQNRIKQIEKPICERLGITHESVLRELKKLAFSNMKDFVVWGANGVTLISSEDLSDEQSACVSEVSEQVGEFGSSLKFKLHDKKGALDTLGKHIGLVIEHVDHTTKGKELSAPIQHVWNMVNPETKKKIEELDARANEIAKTGGL